MRHCSVLFFIFTVALCRCVLAAGPAANPEKYPDYGGTPDLVLSGDMGISDEELETILNELGAANLKDRIGAASKLQKNGAGSEAVIRKRLWRANGVSHRDIRGVLQNALASKNGDGGVLGALLQMSPNSPAVKATTAMSAMLVVLHGLDTMAGYKVLLDFSGHYAGAFRGLIGELMVQAGLKALPALIYGRGSANKELHMFSVAWIRDMGDPLLSQQIQGIRSSRRLAQLLEAYASVNELDAMDVTLSCANHESEIVRNAARASLKVYGKNAKWSIHREFENAFGEEPESGDFEQWAQSLFDMWDKARESKTVALLEKGTTAARQGKFDKMDHAYRELLSVSPLNPHRTQMAGDYLLFASALAEKAENDRAILITRMARRLADENSAAFKEATSRLTWLHAEAMRENGALDVTAYRELQKSANLRAPASQWAVYGEGDDSDKYTFRPVVIPVSVFVFMGLLMIFWRVRVRH